MSTNTATSTTTGNSHRKVVLEALSSSATPLSALELARTCNLEKAVVNTCLYNLLQRGKACIEETHGKRPLWSSTVASIEEKSYQKEEQQLRNVLEQSGASGASTFSIALKLSKQVKVVNQMLYALQEAGEVERVHISPPAWRLKITDRNSRSDGATPQELQDTVETNSSRKRQRSIPEMGNDAHSSDSSPDSSSSEADSDPPAKKRCLLQKELTIPRPKLSVEDSFSKFHTNPEEEQVDTSWAEKCAKAVWKQYKNLNKEARENDVIAGFLLKEVSSNKPRLVAIGSGTAIAGGQNYSMQGLVVHDSHAEIVARRSLLRWLYHQLEMVESDDTKSSSVYVAVKKDPDQGQDRHYQIGKPFELWLYISLAPCGDGGVYSRTDLMLTNKNQHLSAHGRGEFRMKTEAGLGSPCSTAHQMYHEITMDGLPRGDRALCHSCSDKIAKWNVLGVQGALLSRLISPLYLTGVVIGDAFHHGNLARALCCRSEAALGNASLVPPFALAHPRIRKALKSSPRHQQLKKHPGKSINWMEGEAKAEIVDSRLGLVADRKRPSQICKSSLFSQFSKLVPGATKLTCLENKEMAGDYHTAKKTWRDAMEHRHHGRWMQKPKEVDIFKM